MECYRRRGRRGDGTWPGGANGDGVDEQASQRRAEAAAAEVQDAPGKWRFTMLLGSAASRPDDGIVLLCFAMLQAPADALTAGACMGRGAPEPDQKQSVSFAIFIRQLQRNSSALCFIERRNSAVGSCSIASGSGTATGASVEFV